MPGEFNRDVAKGLDEADPLSALRSEFEFPLRSDGTPVAYFAGNSLGLMPRMARAAINQILTDWGERGVRAHFDGPAPWYRSDEPIGAHMAGLVGAAASEVAVMGSLTTNLHLLMASFYRPVGRRRKILIEAHAFPSDRYAVAGQVALHGGDPATDVVEIATKTDSVTASDIEDVLRRHDGEVSMALLGAVNYYTGQLLDLQATAALMGSREIVLGYDLAHAAGNVPLDLHDWGVDFGAWCTYKYLNAGPGSTAAIFVHDRHADTVTPRLPGWWGNDPDMRFEMQSERVFTPRRGAAGWKVSNPSVLAMAPVAASAQMFSRVGMAALRERSIRLTRFLETGLQDLGGATVITPSDPARRGAQLSLRVGVDPLDLEKELARRDVIVDARDPDVVRLAPAPMYNSFEDVVSAVEALTALLGSRSPA
ncbi:MAG: kynureninase [Acidimicrobiales bacterium]